MRCAMRRDDLDELQYIAPMANLPSILSRGILSHNRAVRLPHESVAMEEIQDRRKGKRIPGGLMLHDYVNLYFCARNPMMYKRHDQHLKLCVVRVDLAVLDLPGVVISDMNAAKGYAAFRPVDEGLARIDKDELFAEYWTDPRDVYESERLRGVKCAEALVPRRVDPKFILGVRVSCAARHGPRT
jgi:hypothetical protein